jgi:hypothetical protein
MSDVTTPVTSGSITVMPTAIWERYALALDEIETRKARILAALTAAQVPHALIGDQAVIAWVASRDPAAVRTTKDVDILLNRADLPAAREAVQAAGFEYFEVDGVGMFVDQSNPNPRHAVHIVWAGELVRPDNSVPAPKMDQAVELPAGQRTVSLEALVVMKLVAFRRHDQVHIADMVGVGLVDASWLARLPPVLAQRLKEILDNPES